ncbi:hypothetical protein MTR_4g116110 [Medicago truncatula]|uniref:Uncharacterized protein n=1 Tax=Medicago truncatula TaxID=3880 RepID=G7JGL4_MEDTR|nr:hypothetical protein MTR_4g116110 [Medicago truncatula]
MKALWKLFKSLGKRSLKGKVLELVYPSGSSMCPSSNEVKFKGRVKNDRDKVSKEYDCIMILHTGSMLTKHILILVDSHRCCVQNHLNPLRNNHPNLLESNPLRSRNFRGY